MKLLGFFAPRRAKGNGTVRDKVWRRRFARPLSWPDWLGVGLLGAVLWIAWEMDAVGAVWDSMLWWLGVE